MRTPLQPLVLVTMVTGCGHGAGGGNDLVCLSPEPTVVMGLLARDDDPVIAIDYDTASISIWEDDVEVWRPLNAPSGTLTWTVGADGSYMALQNGALSRAMDPDVWETIGPGVPDASYGNGFLMGAPTTDGSYWAIVNIWGDPHPMVRLLPGAQEWTDAFTAEIGWTRLGGMGNDGSIWLVPSSPADGSQLGLFRMAPDGSGVDLVFDCQRPELLYCTATLYAMAFNADGDLFYYLRNDLSGDHRFFQVKAGTDVAIDRGGLPALIDAGEGDVPLLHGTSIAAAGDTLYIVARDSYEEGSSYLLASKPGDSEARLVTETQGPNAGVVVSTNGEHVFTHTPGVCELR